jgi:hypothetical protein
MASPARFYAMLFAVGIGTFAIHEFGHWLAGTLLGLHMVGSPNHVWASSPMSVAQAVIVSAAGPLVTLGQAAIGFIAARSRGSLFGFALLYMAFFMRLVAAGVSLFNPNDEARVSQLLGLGSWVLPLLVVGCLLAAVVVTSRRLGLRFRQQVYCYLVASVVVSLIVGADAVLWGKA